MNDLITWLPAQLDEDERVARAASPAPWRVVYYEPGAPGLTSVEIQDRDGGGIADNEHGAIPPGPEDAEHIGRYDPARVLAEVDAKRRIVDLHAELHECPDWDRALGETYTAYVGGDECPTLRLLALPYAARPGYREDWRP